MRRAVYKYGMAEHNGKPKRQVKKMIERLEKICSQYLVAFQYGDDIFKAMVENAAENANVEWPAYDDETGRHTEELAERAIKKNFYCQWSKDYNPFYAMNHIEAYFESGDSHEWYKLSDLELCEKMINYWADVELQRQIDLYDSEGYADDCYDYDCAA